MFPYLRRARNEEKRKSSIGDGGFDAFLRNCAQTEPSPILRFCRMVHRMVFIFCAHIGKLYDPKNGKLYDPENGKLYDPKKWKTICFSN